MLVVSSEMISLYINLFIDRKRVQAVGSQTKRIGATKKRFMAVYVAKTLGDNSEAQKESNTTLTEELNPESSHSKASAGLLLI